MVNKLLLTWVGQDFVRDLSQPVSPHQLVCMCCEVFNYVYIKLIDCKSVRVVLPPDERRSHHCDSCRPGSSSYSEASSALGLEYDVGFSVISILRELPGKFSFIIQIINLKSWMFFHIVLMQ